MFIVEWFFCPDGITPNSGLTGPNNSYIYIYVYIKESRNLDKYLDLAGVEKVMEHECNSNTEKRDRGN